MTKYFVLRALLFSVLLGVCATGYSQPRATLDPSPRSFAFALIGDLAYRPEQEPWLEHLLTELQQTLLAFVVHVGDLGAPSRGSCTNEFWARRLAQFQASAHPFIYTPGDNEWTDCHDKREAPGYEPLERLARLRTVFFPGEQSLGQRTLPLTRQSQTTDPVLAKYRENAGGRRRIRRTQHRQSGMVAPGVRPGPHEPEPGHHDHAASQYLSRVPAVSRTA